MKSRWLSRINPFVAVNSRCSGNSLVISESRSVGHGQGSKALNLFMKMRMVGIRPNHVDFSAVLGVCGREGFAHFGSMIHAIVLKSLDFNSEHDHDLVVVLNSLVSMYSKCENLWDAVKIFNRMRFRDTVSWNSVIVGCLRARDFDTGFVFFKQMINSGTTQFDQATLTSILSVCDEPEFLSISGMMHSLAFLSGHERETSVGNALVTAYFRCGCFRSARQVFDEMSEKNVITWTAMISGLAQFDMGKESLCLFSQMRSLDEKCMPNSSTFSSSLLACSGLQALREGQQIHGLVLKTGNQSDLCTESALMYMYSKCSNMEDACKIFDWTESFDIVSMTVILVGFCQNGMEDEALKLFLMMIRTNVEIDSTIISSVLGVFSSDPSLSLGKQIHSLVIKKRLFKNLFVGNGLINMYSKCGDLEEATQVFDKMPQRNSVSWNSMIASFARHGRASEALQFFKEMKLTDVKPTDITFLSLLHACSHVGSIEEGLNFLESMSKDYGIVPRMEHYACVVDMLGRAGHLSEAKSFIDALPMEPGVLVWQALLGACGIHSNVEMGRYAAEQLLRLAPECSAAYVLLSNIYSVEGRWEERAKIIKAMKEMGVKKETGISWIEVEKQVHSFVVEDRVHPKADQIYGMLDELTTLMREEGYVPDKRFVLYDLVH